MLSRDWAVPDDLDCRDQHGHTLITFTSAQKAWAWLCAEASRQPGWLPPRAERPHNGRRPS